MAKYKCDKCGKKFEKKSDAEKHENSCSKTSREDSSEVPIIEEGKIPPFEDLNEGEKILDRFIPSHIAYLSFYIIGGFLCLTLYGAIIGIPLILGGIYHRKGKKYYITNQRIILDFQFVSKRVSSIPYKKIQDVHLTQSLGDRMFEVGDIHINTAGSNAMELVIKQIKNKKTKKNLIEKMIHKSPNIPNDESSDNYSEIEKLHGLMKKGIITKKEFEKKKAKLL